MASQQARNENHEQKSPVAAQEKLPAPQSRALVPIAMSSLGMLQPSNLAELIEYAKIVASSGMVPKQFEKNPGAVIVAMQLGAEVGLNPMAALQNIAVINNRATLWGDAVKAVVVSNPLCEYVKEDDLETIKKNGKAVCVAKRKGQDEVRVTFTVDDAKTAGLWGGNVWAKYPSRMLQMRARAFALRDAFPDILRGIGIAEEERDRTIDMTADWGEPATPAEPQAGVHRVGRRPSAQAPQMTEADLGEPPHDPATGEVKEEAAPAPAQEQKPAQDTSYGPPPMGSETKPQEPEPKKAEAPKGQKGLGW